MPKYDQPSFIKNRREQLKNTLDENRNILNENQIGEESRNFSPDNANPVKSEEIVSNDILLDHNTKQAEEDGREQDPKDDISFKEKKTIKPGRPKKESSVLRDITKTIKFDKATNNRLREVKYNYEFDFQDIVFLAVNEYLDTHFPKGKAEKEDLKNIMEQIGKLNNKRSKKKE